MALAVEIYQLATRELLKLEGDRQHGYVSGAYALPSQNLVVGLVALRAN